MSDETIIEEASIEDATVTDKTPRRGGRPKKEPILFDAFSIEADDNKNWYPVRITIDRNTGKVISTERMTPRGSTRTNALLALETFSIRWRTAGTMDGYYVNR